MLTALLRRMLRGLLVAVICTAWAIQPVPAEEATSEGTKEGQAEKGPSVGELSLEDIKAKRTATEASTALSDSVKKSVLGFLDQTIRFRELTGQFDDQAKAIAKEIEEAPKRREEIQKELDQAPPTTESIEGEASKLETEKLEQRIHQEEAALSNVKSALSERETKLEQLRNRPQTLRESVSKAKARLEELRQELSAAPEPDEPSELTEARRLAQLAEQTKCQAEIRASDQMLAGNEVLLSLQGAERDLAAREAAWREATAKAWQEQGQKRREQEATKAREEAEQASQRAYDLPPAIQAQLQINIKRSEELERVTEQEARTTQRLERKKVLLKEIEEEYALARQRVEAAALTQTIGLALRQQRQSLPELRSFRRNSAERKVLMSDLREARLQIDRERRELADLDSETDRIVKGLDPFPEGELDSMRNEVRRLLSDRRDLLEKLQATYRRAFKDLQELEFADQQVVSKAKAYAEFLDLHLLWMRSSTVIGAAYLRDLTAALRWITSPTNWLGVVREAGRSFGRGPLVWVLGLLVGAALLRLRRYARRDLTQVAKRVGRVQTDSFVLTLRALGMTVCLAAGWPFLIGLVGIQLRLSPTAPDFTRAISVGMIVAALVLLLFGFLRTYCRKDGLAHIHFDWPESARLALLHNLSWLLPVLLIALFLTWACELGKRPEFPDSLGRLAFVAGMIAVSFFMARVLRLSGGVVAPLKKRHPDGWLVKTRGVWYSAAVGVPLLEALMALMGYYYTALVLWRYVHATIWFLIGVLMLQGLLLRWLLIAKRRLAFEEAKREKAAEREAARAKASEGQEGVDLDTFPLEEPEIDLDQMGDQTRSLLRIATFFAVLAGLWAIWSPILPALNVLETVELWSYRAEVDGIARRIPITLHNLVQAIIVVIIALVAARNLPGVLEITLLKRLPLDAGARYAFTTICRYVLTGIGIVVAFSVVGFSWSKLQWLIAALGVGLGFGLQEIVANFISGLIILFERPYRVGDVVTVGDIMGVISRIRIRATTITDWDRRELIVPNKDFITGRLINWTLSDAITRIRVPVGIAYGSDTGLAEKLLLRVASENPKVREDPPPLALFQGFGDNSLNFDLRVFVSELGDRLPVLHELHMAIDREFRKAGIAIAFPQRDVHLDAAEPLHVRVVSDQNGAAESEGSAGGKSQA